jgi:hypothetical protein
MPPEPRQSFNRGALIPESKDEDSFSTVPSYRGGTENRDFHQNSTRSRDNNNRINGNSFNYEGPEYEKQSYLKNNGSNRNNQSFIGPQSSNNQRNNDREHHFNPNNQKQRIMTDNPSDGNPNQNNNFVSTTAQSNSRNTKSNVNTGRQSQNMNSGFSNQSKSSNNPRNGNEKTDMNRNQNHDPNISNTRGMNNQQYRGGMGGGYGGMGGGYGGMGMGMGGMGMGGMGMMGPFSWIYSLNNIIHSIPMVVDVLGMNSQMVYDLYNQILAILMKIINFVKKSDFRRFLQQKSRRSRALRIAFIIVSMGLASQAMRLVKLLVQHDFSQNRLLTNI